MQYKALVSFSSVKLSMATGDVREISDTSIANDLLKAGYVIPLDPDEDDKKVKEVKEPEESQEETKAEKPKTKRKGKKSDGN